MGNGVGLTAIPTPIPDTLQSLSILGADVRELPSLAHCKSMHTLCVGAMFLRRIEAFPPSLKHLRIGGGGLESFPPLPASLVTLGVSLHHLRVLRAGHCTKLVSLDAHDCLELKSLGLPPALVRLDLGRCEELSKLSPLPSTLSELDISDTFSITSLSVSQCTRLQEIKASRSSLRKFSPARLPKSLRVLHIDECMFSSLPPLPEGLEELRAENNGLSELPKLPSTLRVLNVADNNLARIPPWPATMRGSDVNFLGNPLKEFPPGVCFVNDAHFREYRHLMFPHTDSDDE